MFFMNFLKIFLSRHSFKHIRQTVIASASILSLSISFNLPSLIASAQPTDPDPRWNGIIRDTSISGVAAAKAVQLVVNTLVDPIDITTGGFVAHALWVGTGSDSWVEVGYDREPDKDPDHNYYYWASGTPSSYTHVHKGYAIAGNYSEQQIIWDNNTKFWKFYFEGQFIGQAANVGGPSSQGVGVDAGLETTSDRNVSPPAPLYGMKYATLSNWIWQDWPNPNRIEDPPARVYWVNPPFSAETRMNQ